MSTPARPLSEPLPAEPPPLAHEDGPADLSTSERILAAGLCLPWLAAATGWAYLVTAHAAWRWLRR